MKFLVGAVGWACARPQTQARRADQMSLLNNAEDTGSAVLSGVGPTVAGLPIRVNNMWNAGEEGVNGRHYI